MTEVEDSAVSTASKDLQSVDSLLNQESGNAANSEQRSEDEKAEFDVNEEKTGDKDKNPKTENEKDKTAENIDGQNKGDQDKKSDDNYRRGGAYGRCRMGGRFRMSFEEKHRRWEEEQKKKTVIQSGVSGTVKWYSFYKNYGFIERDDDTHDVFVHQLAISKSRIRKTNLRTLEHGEKVQFDVVQGKKGLEASNVTGPNGTEVQGMRIIFIFTENYGRTNRGGLRYFDNYNNRPAYYDNYRNLAYCDRDFRQRNSLYARPRYAPNRGSAYPGNSDRSYPRGRNHYYPAKRDRSYTENRRNRLGNRNDNKRDEAHELSIEHKNNDKKNELRPSSGRKFGRRRVYNKRNNQNGGTLANSETSIKKSTEKSSVEKAKVIGQDGISEDLVKGVAAIQVQ